MAIGLILLGSGLDDTSSTARVDASDSSGDDNGSSDDPDDGSGDDAVGSPLSPSEINVIVANGAGVEGAAATISATLTDLGYVPLPATNTVVPTSETPLDTVYYATSPNTQAQAEQVAEDLGISPSAVLAYPGQETAPAADGPGAGAGRAGELGEPARHGRWWWHRDHSSSRLTRRSRPSVPPGR